MNRLLNSADFRKAARRRLPRSLFEYIDRGAEDERALSDLRRSLDDINLMPRMLTGHAERDLSTTVLGQQAKLPIMVAPTALAGLVAHNGEIRMAKAASAAGIPICISTQSITTIEEIRAGAPEAMLWFQLYVWKDRSLTRRLLERVAAAGVTTLVLTVDTPVVPNREYNMRNGFSIPMKMTPRATADVLLHPRWLFGVLLRYMMTTGMPVYGHYPQEFRSAITRPSVSDAVKPESLLNWEDLRELRQWWKGQLVVKGIFSVDDARKCREIGADGIVVSSHGGRNIDSAPATARVLPVIADAVGDHIEVMADSGVQRGSDILKYLSLGAKSVMLGRLPLWGLACGGETGAGAMFSMLRNEMDTTLALLGARTPDDVELLPPEG
ncbi:alpha-hydroxy-acid oxidizing protein [Rhizobiales bacterium RZME27]|uniref:Alpha-hydroxy-acid oxidizing protein n=1 Tax=Endobacterium cereale TaxID=2663029 RepID=A0A6A8A5R6_9HYPH|nr:alpha-hydroxy acid oxidase [Endobacterium cereale]MEB2846291.1 alpha-hydroxy acid oxidase [Endobacterium cereale]MQY46413.1 alpha-hydroxy-acid oxidizing protein [Endobacterium cereale]